MLTAQEQKVIDQYVDEDYYDKEKLIKYLNMHDVVGNEVFQYCDKHKVGAEQSTYSNWLNNEYGYRPLSISTFVKRIPFYFYTREIEEIDLENMGTLEYIYCSCSHDIIGGGRDIESIYHALEYMFYSLELPLNRIFSYWINQTGNVSGEGFFQWDHYLHLCEELGITNYFPERFITSYNEVLEDSAMSPIIYEISECGIGDVFLRNGTKIEFEGRFPCDKNGKPIMKWIGIKATNVNNNGCSVEKSKLGRLWIDITPSTIVHVLNFYNDTNDDDDYWYQVYAGPKTMQFDYTVLKERRKKLGFTQQQVADAVETTVRTYQKWESGETTPDGHFLIRLMNWLDIPDIQNAIEYTAIQN